MSNKINAAHTPLEQWTESILKPLPSMVATAASQAGLADAAWRAMFVEGSTGLEISITGALTTAYSGKAAEAEIAQYAEKWGDGVILYDTHNNGRVYATAMIKVEGIAPAAVWADIGAADSRTLPAGVVAGIESRIPALIGPGVG